MYPAWSIIFFTVISGLGLGLANCAIFGVVDLTEPLHLFIFSGLTFGLIGSGLISSTLHLGHPERAWRALSQWKSSWLSREGVLAILVLGLLFLWFLCSFLYETPSLLFGFPLSVLIFATVFATSMIYASLKTVSCWFHPLTPVCYLLFSISGGLLFCISFMTFFNQHVSGALQFLTGTSILIAWFVKFFWWQNLDSNKFSSTLSSATGLESFTEVNTLMPPHTSENYLQKEMGFVIARKHAVKLRFISIFFGGLMPISFLFFLDWVSLVMVIASLLHLLGMFVERWLFFAEAKHVVSTYYS